VKIIPRTTIPVPINEAKCVELSKAVAGLMVVATVVAAIEGSLPVKIGDRSNPNLETTKPRPIRATHVLNQARKVL